MKQNSASCERNLGVKPRRICGCIVPSSDNERSSEVTSRSCCCWSNLHFVPSISPQSDTINLYLPKTYSEQMRFSFVAALMAAAHCHAAVSRSLIAAYLSQKPHLIKFPTIFSDRTHCPWTGDSVVPWSLVSSLWRLHFLRRHREGRLLRYCSGKHITKSSIETVDPKILHDFLCLHSTAMDQTTQYL